MPAADAGDGVGLAVDPAVGEGLIARRLIQRRDPDRPGRERTVGGQGRCDPGAVRHVDDVGGADIDDKPREHGVDRVRRRVVQIERSQARAFGVGHVPHGAVAVGTFRDRTLHARVGRRRGDALLERRREHVGLERGPGGMLRRDGVDLVLLVVAAAEHRADRPRVRAERHDRDIGLRVVARVLRCARPRRVRGLLRGLLPVGVERRDDVEPAFGQRPLSLLRGAAQHRVPAVRVIDDLLLHVVDQERRCRQPRAPDVGGEHDVGVLGSLPLGDRDAAVRRAERDHPVQHVVAAKPRRVRMRDRVVLAGPLVQTGEQRRLGE